MAAVGLPGDYNSNGTVDAADYVVWRNVTGTAATLPNRDPSQSGNIGPGDYSFWRQNFGRISGAGSGVLSGSSAVPEPASAILLAVSCLLFSLACHDRVVEIAEIRCAFHEELAIEPVDASPSVPIEPITCGSTLDWPL